MYSRVMIDLPLVYEDTEFLGDVEAIQCCVPYCAKEGRGLCQAQGLENWGVSLGGCFFFFLTIKKNVDYS